MTGGPSQGGSLWCAPTDGAATRVTRSGIGSAVRSAHRQASLLPHY